MNEKKMKGIVGIITAIAISVDVSTVPAVIAQESRRGINPELYRRINAIQESMINGGCWPTQAEEAAQVLRVLDRRKAQGLVLYSGRENIQAAIRAIQGSRLPSLFLVACGWFIQPEHRTIGYQFIEIEIIEVTGPTRIVRERRRTGEYDPIDTPPIVIYEVVKL